MPWTPTESRLPDPGSAGGSARLPGGTAHPRSLRGGAEKGIGEPGNERGTADEESAADVKGWGWFSLGIFLLLFEHLPLFTFLLSPQVWRFPLSYTGVSPRPTCRREEGGLAHPRALHSENVIAALYIIWKTLESKSSQTSLPPENPTRWALPYCKLTFSLPANGRIPA